MRMSPWSAGMILLASLAVETRARAETPSDETTQACVQAYQSTQELRLDGKVHAARESAALCAREACPAAVQSGCTKWLRELIDGQPSLLVTAHEGGKDVSDAAVYVDGERAAESLTGRPIEVDPGKHTVRLARRAGPAVEQTVVVLEGAKNRAITFDLGAPPAKPGGGRGAPVGPIVFGAAGLASIAAFAALAITGSRDLGQLRDTCGQTHSCEGADIRAIKTKLVAGDVLLAAGVVSLGVGIGWTIKHFTADPEPARASIGLHVMPENAGGRVAFSLTY